MMVPCGQEPVGIDGWPVSHQKSHNQSAFRLALLAGPSETQAPLLLLRIMRSPAVTPAFRTSDL